VVPEREDFEKEKPTAEVPEKMNHNVIANRSKGLAAKSAGEKMDRVP
jgi:hypothetical protein